MPVGPQLPPKFPGTGNTPLEMGHINHGRIQSSAGRVRRDVCVQRIRSPQDRGVALTRVARGGAVVFKMVLLEARVAEGITMRELK